MNSLHLSIPAKALLFGEYGVLYGGKAIAVTFFSNCFHISIKIQKITEDETVTVQSEFFPRKFIQFPIHELSNNSFSKNDTNIFFFGNLLRPWKKVLKSCKLEIYIEKSYPPALGFGSSSALIAGVSRGLWELIYQNKEYLNSPLFWKNIRDSIKNIQGNGSGYDVAVQLAASQNNPLDNKTKLWIFQNKKESPIPSIQSFIPNEDISKYGCFLSTNIYSNTTQAIKMFQNEKNKLDFAKKHTSLANWFLLNHSVEDLKIGMEKSLKIANQQRILPTNIEKFNRLLSILATQHISYKTMGAGHGDCLWVLTSRKKLAEECHIPETDIPFSFEIYGTES